MQRRLFRGGGSSGSPQPDFGLRATQLLMVPVWQRAIFTAIMVIFLVLFALPLYWLLVAATKSNAGIYGTFGFWFSAPFKLGQNIVGLFAYRSGIFLTWIINTIVYAAVGGGGAAILAAAGGYALAAFRFSGRRLAFGVVLASMLIPYTALAIPEYILYSKVGLVNNMLGLIVPSMVSPLGLYLMKIYIESSIPRALLEAARLDGAGELRILVKISFPLMLPGFTTVLLFSIVASWNNYFLPFILFSKESLFPITVGLTNMAGQATIGGGSGAIEPEIIAGGLVSIVPIMLLFLVLQRYWRSGLLLGSLVD